jgi:hypothetical protein
MDKANLTARLAAARAPAGDVASGKLQVTSRLAEASQHLKQARLCLLAWVRDNYLQANSVDESTDTVMDLLALARQIENIRSNVDVKASVTGK